MASNTGAKISTASWCQMGWSGSSKSDRESNL